MGLLKDSVRTNPETNQNQRCHILFLEKNKDQIDYEYHNISSQDDLSHIDSLHYQLQNYTLQIKKRINKQNDLFKEAFDALKQKVPDWGYESFYICDSGRLESLFGYKREQAMQCHAVILFHKKKLNDSS